MGSHTCSGPPGVEAYDEGFRSRIGHLQDLVVVVQLGVAGEVADRRRLADDLDLLFKSNSGERSVSTWLPEDCDWFQPQSRTPNDRFMFRNDNTHVCRGVLEVRD